MCLRCVTPAGSAMLVFCDLSACSLCNRRLGSDSSELKEGAAAGLDCCWRAALSWSASTLAGSCADRGPAPNGHLSGSTASTTFSNQTAVCHSPVKACLQQLLSDPQRLHCLLGLLQTKILQEKAVISAFITNTVLMGLQTFSVSVVLLSVCRPSVREPVFRTEKQKQRTTLFCAYRRLKTELQWRKNRD